MEVAAREKMSKERMPANNESINKDWMDITVKSHYA